MTTPAPVDFGEVAQTVIALMEEHPVSTPESRAAMGTILDLYEGAIITGHGHDHVHTIVGFHIRQTDENILKIDIRTSPCPPKPSTVPVIITKVDP